MVSHYEILGVTQEASEGEVRRQYQLLAVRLHPDKPAGSHSQFTKLKEAYNVLADPHQRHEYDLQLKRDQLYQQYPISEELFLEDMQLTEAEGYSHRCRCGGSYILPCDEATNTTDSELAVVCDNCSLAVIVLLPQNIQTFQQNRASSFPGGGSKQAGNEDGKEEDMSKIDNDDRVSVGQPGYCIPKVSEILIPEADVKEKTTVDSSLSNIVERRCIEGLPSDDNSNKNTTSVTCVSSISEINSSSTTSSSSSNHSPIASSENFPKSPSLENT